MIVPKTLLPSQVESTLINTTRFTRFPLQVCLTRTEKNSLEDFTLWTRSRPWRPLWVIICKTSFRTRKEGIFMCWK